MFNFFFSICFAKAPPFCLGMQGVNTWRCWTCDHCFIAFFLRYVFGVWCADHIGRDKEKITKKKRKIKREKLRDVMILKYVLHYSTESLPSSSPLQDLNTDQISIYLLYPFHGFRQKKNSYKKTFFSKSCNMLKGYNSTGNESNSLQDD